MHRSYVYLRAEKTDEIILYILLRHYDADLLTLGIGVFIRPVLAHKQRPDRAVEQLGDIRLSKIVKRVGVKHHNGGQHLLVFTLLLGLIGQILH